MLDLDRPEKSQLRSYQPSSKTAAGMSSNDRHYVRQSWSSDERLQSSVVSLASTSGSVSGSSSTHSKEPKTLWGRLRKQTSKLHIGSHAHSSHASASTTPRLDTSSSNNSSCVSLPPAADATQKGHSATRASTAGSIGTMKSNALGPNSAASLSLPTPRSSTSEAPSSRGSHTQSSAAQSASTLIGTDNSRSTHSQVFAGNSLNLPASPIGDSKTRTSALFANQRTNLVQPRFAEVKAQPTVTRASVEVYRTTGGSFSHTKHLAPTPSYSMDIPRAKIGVDGIESGYVSAASIRKTLSGYAGSSDLQGKPRLRRLITLPRAQKNVYPKDAMGSETAAMGLECIAEDETEEFQVDVRTRSDKREPSVFTGNLGPAEDTADTSLSTRSARPATSSGVMRTALQTGQTADGTTGNTTGSWWVNSKRFSENSGTTISSGDTLDATVEYDAKGIIERRPSGRKSANSGTGTANLVYHHHSTSQLPAKAPIARPPRLSLSNVTRPSAIYEEYINVIPSPTKEDPPKLIPMVHGKANSIDKDLVMDPVVYKNTFFNARPAEEQARLKAQVLSSSTKPSGKTLHKSASEDTLDGSLNKPEGAPIGASRHVRFTDVRDIVTTSMDLIYESDHDERTELASVRRPSTQQASTIAANSSVASMQPRPSTAHSKLGTISNAKADISLPTAAGASVTAPAGAAAATTSTANISSKTSSNTLLPATAASTKATPNKQAVQPTADNGAAKQIDNLKQEIEALKRTVRNLQSHNDMLTELAMRDPLEDIPEDARLHIRTIELENAWLRKELSQLKHSTNA